MVDLTPEGLDGEGWTVYRTSFGDLVRVRRRPDGGVDVRFPKDKYELKEVYDVESTGDVVIDLVRKAP